MPVSSFCRGVDHHNTWNPTFGERMQLSVSKENFLFSNLLILSFTWWHSLQKEWSFWNFQKSYFLFRGREIYFLFRGRYICRCNWYFALTHARKHMHCSRFTMSTFHPFLYKKKKNSHGLFVLFYYSHGITVLKHIIFLWSSIF